MSGFGSSRVFFAASVDFGGVLLILVVSLWVLSIVGMFILIQRARKGGKSVRLPKNWLSRKRMRKARS